MNGTHNHIADNDEHLQEILPECPVAGRAVVSPLGWSIKGRLLCSAAAAALLWLAVGWAMGSPK